MLEKAEICNTHINNMLININIIDRDDMHGLSSMYLEGEDRNLGIVKNFKDNQELAKYIPKDLSISWTHLNSQETLDTHRHPIASLVIAVEGNGRSKGDSEIKFKGGDAIVIPAWNEHGFTGAAPDGFWALSIQFHHIAIFENAIDPLTVFNDDETILPSLSERQLQCISATEISDKKNHAKATFKSNKTLQDILPNNTDFCWHEVDSIKNLKAPKKDSKRLIMVCSGQGSINFSTTSLATDINIKSGYAFWQHHDMVFSNNQHTPLTILTLEVKN